MAMEEGQAFARAGKLEKFPYKPTAAAASRWSGRPRPKRGPRRQIRVHRCRCRRPGMLEQFLCEAVIAASSRRHRPCRQICVDRPGCHRRRQGMLEQFLCEAVIAASSRRYRPCRQMCVDRPGCHRRRQGMLEQSLCKAIIRPFKEVSPMPADVRAPPGLPPPQARHA